MSTPRIRYLADLDELDAKVLEVVEVPFNSA
jgi:hypothetical protein